MYIDTHAHLYLPQFEEDLPDVIERARSSGITRILMPNVDLTTAGAIHQVEKDYPDVCEAMMGLHPCSVDSDFEVVLTKTESMIGQRDYVAIGEIGIDLYWDKTFFQEQIEAFRIQVQWAHEKKWPIVIHSRESIDEILEILEGLSLPGLKGVFHCFTGSIKQAERILDLGFLMGIGGVVTFKNGGLDQVLPKIDLESLVLETDAPYLAPHPYRGKRNESSYIPIVADKIAFLYKTTVKEIARITTRQANDLFVPIQPNQGLTHLTL